jgi:sRNA-binding protein
LPNLNTGSQRMTATHNPPSPAPRSARDIIAALANLFPQAFTAERWQTHKPLKIGIHHDLIGTGVLTRREVRSALHAYTNRRMYLTATAAGEARIGLDGTPSGTVSPDEAAFAQQRLVSLDAAAAAHQVDRDSASKALPLKRPGTAPSSPQAPHEHTQPSISAHRHSLADLREAAAARRAAAVGCVA